MEISADKFARLAALRPVRSVEVQSEVIRTNEPLPQTDEECMLARMIGATVARTKFGSHLSVRNWHATPEFCEPSEGVVELLRSAAARKNGGEIHPLLRDVGKWLFLDTETT